MYVNEESPILVAQRICYNFQSDDKTVRKKALINLQEHLSVTNLTEEILRQIFNELHIYVLKAFRDKSEAVRSQAIKFMFWFLLEKLTLNDYYLTYIFPILVERIGTVELVEESEEIRLELLQFLQAIIWSYSNTKYLKPFINDIITVLCETVKDKYPEIKQTSCKCITNAAQAFPRDFHLQSENLVKPVLTAFKHQRYKVRMEAILCIGKHINCKNL